MVKKRIHHVQEYCSRPGLEASLLDGKIQSMSRGAPFTAEDFRNYRSQLGFGNQAKAKDFLGAKDIVPSIDLAYMALLNQRLGEVVDRINKTADSSIRPANLEAFKKEYIDTPFDSLKEGGILPALNNQGRRPEQVYFSWMRGFVVSSFFTKALCDVFGVSSKEIEFIGDDNFRKAETFKRTPRADMRVTLPDGKRIHIEMQSGFTGTNDIKLHKVLEARRIFREEGLHSYAFHFDIFNGQVAVVCLDSIEDGDVNWITRQQMENQTVFNIDQNLFVWKLTEPPPRFSELNLG